MCAQTIVLSSAPYVGDVIDGDLFAANTLFTSNYLDPGGAYDRMLQELNWDGLRFPGGTITEELFDPGSEFVERFFDTTTPSGVSDVGSPRIVTAPSAFQYASERDLTFHFTLPTKNYFMFEAGRSDVRITDQFGLYQLLARTDEIIRGEYGEINITSFEIGNEFWYRPFNPSTPTEYGILADRLGSNLQALFDVYQDERGGPAEWTQPLIAAQSAPSWLPSANQEIFEQLSLDAREAIDAVITHYYPSNYTIAGTRLRTFDRLDEWQELEGVEQNLKYFISEWNIQNGGETGLVQASGLLEMMSTMVARDVDYAAVWGTQYFSLGSRLAAIRNDPTAPGGQEYTLTASGEVFRMMSENLQGLQLLDIDTPSSLRAFIDVPQNERPPEGAEQLVLHAYANDDTTIVFVSSRSEIPIDVTLDPASLVPDYHHAWAELLGVLDDPRTPNRDEGDPTSRFAQPYIRTFNHNELIGPSGIAFTLQPYEIIKIEFTTGEIGVQMSGQDFVVDPAADYDDELLGTGYDDIIYGGAGDNILRGNAGDDILIGGPGNDFLGGWTGNDLLDGGGGNNTLRGGDGDDILIARDGVNFLRGDAGQDQFIVSPAGQTTIADLDLDGGEGLSLMKFYNDIADVLDRTETQGNDLVIAHDGGGWTRLVGLGGRAGDLSGALSDFQPASPVSDLVNALNTPGPDGSIPPDPGAGDPKDIAEPLVSREEINAFLTSEDSEEITAYIRDLSPEEEESLLDQLNANALALSSTQTLWGAFSESLSDEGFTRLMESTDPDILEMRYARIAADQYEAGTDTALSEDRLPLDRTLFEIDAEIRIDLFLLFSSAQRADLEQIWAASNPDQADLTASEIYRLSDDEIEGRRIELLSTDAPPSFARYLLPGHYDNAYLVADEEDEDDQEGDDGDDEEDESANGGGCFIATCAYNNQNHPDVLYLRVFRDVVLSEYAAGRTFIRIYYRVGPQMAKTIATDPLLKQTVRRMISYLVKAMKNRHTR